MFSNFIAEMDVESHGGDQSDRALKVRSLLQSYYTPENERKQEREPGADVYRNDSLGCVVFMLASWRERCATG